MKKIFLLVSAVAMMALVGCGSSSDKAASEAIQEATKVEATKSCGDCTDCKSGDDKSSCSGDCKDCQKAETKTTECKNSCGGCDSAK